MTDETASRVTAEIHTDFARSMGYGEYLHLDLLLAAQHLGCDFFNQLFVHGTSIPRSPLTKPQALASS